MPRAESFEHPLRDESNFRRPLRRFADLESFLAEPALEGERSYSIAFPDSYLDLEWYERGTETLIVVFSGAKSMRNTSALPFFSGRGVSRRDRLSAVLVADPALYRSESLRLAWYLGSDATPMAETLPAVLAKILERSSARRVLFLGGSGGGFAALRYSYRFPDSLALVWNPQTDVLRYATATWTRYATEALGASPRDAAEIIRGRVSGDLTELYDPGRMRNRVVYIQNTTDRHVDRHLNPFLARFGHPGYRRGDCASEAITDRLYVCLGDWAPAHGIPRALIDLLIPALAAPSCDWSDCVAPTVRRAAELVGPGSGSLDPE